MIEILGRVIGEESLDALANLDLTPLWELLADASVEKIVHAGEQDIEPVFRMIGRPAANIFDTKLKRGQQIVTANLLSDELIDGRAGVNVRTSCLLRFIRTKKRSGHPVIRSCDARRRFGRPKPVWRRSRE